jgi:hypothetical protein
VILHILLGEAETAEAIEDTECGDKSARSLFDEHILAAQAYLFRYSPSLSRWVCMHLRPLGLSTDIRTDVYGPSASV